MKIVALIPARMGSSRFPGKPMAQINGKPMIGHVYEAVRKSPLLMDVVVATCDEAIYNYITSISGKAIYTSDKHERASDRCAEALLKLEAERSVKYDIVVMVQGDEPMTHPDMIAESITPFFDDESVQVTNLMSVINSVEEFKDRNCIKVVCDLNLNAIFFSREPIPTQFKEENVPMFKQVCVIPFRRDFLIKYTELKPTPLEIAESVDMLRVLENGYKVRMAMTKFQTYAVDTPEDLTRVEKLMSK
ncbi:3-deoxy-manno-octulosonate cytidylyltransferase [Leptospira biflexa]|nr:3-deoxy-manno-octulosonate cytidylyltransferase [Leptospira biflexa]TGM39255.1 3-deoxy-manno-octulosonate cytidylyltransferase [Leptospira biflexa]